MRLIFYYTLFLLISFCGFSQTKLMTYNIRYAEPGDGENYWEERKVDLAGLINYYEPDILGAQEVLESQLDYLKEALPDYRVVGVGRDDGKKRGEYTPIFYRASKFALTHTHTYWLSDTPEKPTMGWDAATIRIVTYAILKERATGKHYVVFNTHLDYKGETARLESAKLILELLKEMQWGESPIIVMGDFNTESGTAPINTFKTVLNDSFDHTTNAPYGPPGTYNRFNTEKVPERRIDYIFTKNLKTLSYRQIDDRRKNGFWVSDHLPVFVEVSSHD